MCYYNLILEQHNEENNLPFANPAALIPLKAKAWLDLSARAKKGEKVEDKDIAKHRSDIFRIANMLPGQPGPNLPGSIQEDLNSLLVAFPHESEEWKGILDSLKTISRSKTKARRFDRGDPHIFQAAISKRDNAVCVYSGFRRKPVTRPLSTWPGLIC